MLQPVLFIYLFIIINIKHTIFPFQVINAEVLFTGFLFEHNIPLAVSDHAGPLFRKMFPDSTIAKKYSCARTKTTAVLNGAMAPEMTLSLVDLKVEPFSLNVDGSNSVRIFDVNRGHVCLRFLDMCASSISTADGIFTKLDTALTKMGLECSRWVGFSVVNTNVNVGRRDTIMTRVLESLLYGLPMSHYS